MRQVSESNTLKIFSSWCEKKIWIAFLPHRSLLPFMKLCLQALFQTKGRIFALTEIKQEWKKTKSTRDIVRKGILLMCSLISHTFNHVKELITFQFNVMKSILWILLKKFGTFLARWSIRKKLEDMFSQREAIIQNPVIFFEKRLLLISEVFQKSSKAISVLVTLKLNHWYCNHFLLNKACQRC
jgi:hypothetical protein